MFELILKSESAGGGAAAKQLNLLLQANPNGQQNPA